VSAARGGPPTKAELEKKRTKAWHKDEVSEEVNAKLKSGVRADKKKIEGKVLKAATKPGSLVKRPNRRGLKRFPSVITIPDELPDLPENLREFAFRYATEYRTNLDWAHIFHQSTFTIYTWVSREDVAGYIMKIKQERRALMAERLNELEKKAFQKLGKILEYPITEDSIEPIRKTILDILMLKQGGGTTRKTDAALINISQSQGQVQGQSQEQEMSLDQLQQKVSELKQLEEE
jgi:hypothetical protein